MSRKNYFAQYKSPNTVIVPTSVCFPPSPKRPKVEIPLQSQSPQHVDLTFLDEINIDEIVECLFNCDSNIKTLQETVNSSDTSLRSSEQNEVVLSKESSANNNNNGNNYEEMGVIESDTKDLLNISLETNENLEEKEITTKQDDIDSIESLVSKSQSDQALEDHIRLQVISKEPHIIKNHEIQSKSIETECMKKKTDKNELNVTKNNDCSDLNKPTHVDNDVFIEKDKQDTKLIKKEVNKTNDSKEKKESLGQPICHKHKTVPTNAVQSKKDNLCKELGRKMSDYLHSKYYVASVIHHGQFSRIFKCQDSVGKQYAVKMLNNKSDKFILGTKKRKMLMEIQADIPKDNLFCVYLKNTFYVYGFWCFLMEFYPKNLEQALKEKPFHINMVQDLARQLVAAVTLLRNNDIVHSDIKPAHILLNSSNTKLKLCGFDGSYYVCEAIISPHIGSISYRAPEVILGYSAGFSIDVWSTALIIHEMATGQRLFPGYHNWNILYRQMCTLGNIPLDMLNRSYFSNKYFVHGMFKKNISIKEQRMGKNIFRRSNKISKKVYDAYYSHWAPYRTKMQKSTDVQKINSLIGLLNQMLVIYPKHRLSIEFVYANPFIYEMFDC